MSSQERIASSHAERLVGVLQEGGAGGSARMRVLVAGAEPEVAALLATRLPRADAEIVSAASVERTREVMATVPISLIVCNPSLAGDMAGRFFGLLAEHASAAGIPVIGIVDEGSKTDEAELYTLGADAVLTRNGYRSSIVPVVQSYLRKLGAQRRRLLRDPVTGLPNVSVFRDAFQRAASLATREREALSVMVVHIGVLRKVRREKDIQTANELLRAVAEGVSESLRKSDLVARGSGDSLLLLLSNTDVAGAQRVTEKMHDRLERILVLPNGVARGELGLSAGIAEVGAHAPFEEVLESALCGLEPLWGPAERAYRFEPEAGPAWHPRILLAEDDELTATIIRHRLERLGYSVTHAADGAEVLRLATESGISLMILDVKMPYVDGFEALRRLKSIRALRDIPVMMVTSMGNEEDVSRGFDLGADDYLVKPFSPIELQARVQRLLRRCA